MCCVQIWQENQHSEKAKNTAKMSKYMVRRKRETALVVNLEGWNYLAKARLMLTRGVES